MSSSGSMSLMSGTRSSCPPPAAGTACSGRSSCIKAAAVGLLSTRGGPCCTPEAWALEAGLRSCSRCR
eukprot:12458157-Alexandrium_andersonii.AAC.1